MIDYHRVVEEFIRFYEAGYNDATLAGIVRRHVEPPLQLAIERLEINNCEGSEDLFIKQLRGALS